MIVENVKRYQMRKWAQVFVINGVPYDANSQCRHIHEGWTQDSF